jgi:predicted nucleic acid-binding protein
VILADTSVWVNHFRHGDAELARLLAGDDVGLHPFVLGEIAAGTLRQRARVLADLACLPQLAIAQGSEVHHLLESRELWGLGLGWVDLHLLAAAKLAAWHLYTADRAMNGAAARLAITCLPT